MKLSRRIKYYLIGAFMGLLLSFFIFNGRGCNWLPGDRVLNSIQTSKILVSEKDKCILDCNNISSETIYKLIEEGSVHFKKSNPDIKNYFITYNDVSLFMKINAVDTTAIINTVTNTKKCNCASMSAENLSMLYQPNEMALKKLKELTLAIKDDTKCELECFRITTSNVDEIFENGEILFDKSYPNRVPNPIYYIKHQFNNQNYLFWIEQGATKTRLKHVIPFSESDLKNGEPLSSLFEQSLKLKDCNCY